MPPTVHHHGRVTTQTVVAAANVLRDLHHAQAREALAGVLAHEPDLVGLQEWGPKRFGLLREHGSVGLLPGARLRVGAGAYAWTTPLLGGCAVGIRLARYDVLGVRPVVLSWPGHADKPDRPFGLEPPRIAVQATLRDRLSGAVVVLLNYHLVPGVQRDGRYRADRPGLVARHRSEVRKLEAVVAAHHARGHVVHAAGDANFEGLVLAGLTSAWEGREDAPATLDDGRRVDDVFGPGPATGVDLLINPSDHRAVVATRPDR